jgi:hypothetical protein
VPDAKRWVSTSCPDHEFAITRPSATAAILRG